MEELEDYHSPVAQRYADVGFGLIGMGRWVIAEAEREESAYRDQERRRTEQARAAARERQRRHRENERVLAQAQSAPPACDKRSA